MIVSRCEAAHRARRRSFVLLAVLIIVGGALLVATSMTFMAQAEYAGRAAATRALQDRALAWSGTQIVMLRLDEQRERILDGELPELDEQYEIYRLGEDDDARVGIVRLLPIGPAGERVVPESAKLDLNEVDAERLNATGWITSELADAIIAHRDQALHGRLRSVERLLEHPDIHIEELRSPLTELTEPFGEPTDEAAPVTMREAPAIRGLADLLTVYAFEPALQRNGRRRINLDVPWSEELGRRLNERFGDGAAAIVRQIIDQGTTFDRDAVIVQVLRFLEAPIEDWPDILDALTTESGEMHFGRLNINAASAEALESLPGIEPEQAASIVRVRDSLDADERWSPVWPVMQEIISGEQFQAIVESVTTRSWTYRMRLAAGEVVASDVRGKIESPLVWELVIDLSAPSPRIAALREVTLEPIAARLALAMEALAEDEREPWPEDDAAPLSPDEDAAATTLSEPAADPAIANDDDADRDADEAGDASETGDSADQEEGEPALPTRSRLGRWSAG